MRLALAAALALAVAGSTHAQDRPHRPPGPPPHGRPPLPRPPPWLARGDGLWPPAGPPSAKDRFRENLLISLAIGAAVGGASVLGMMWMHRRPKAAAPRVDDALALPPQAFDSFGDRFAGVTYLSRGGMGVVYRARDRDLDRAVAIKALAPEFRGDREFSDRFFREARSMAKLTHSGIVAVHDVVREPVPHIVMELLEGSSLRRLLSDPKRALPPKLLLSIATEIVEAVASAHAAGVIHRDLKPENVFITHAGQAKLLDFGLARALRDTRMTRPDMAVGTPRYMAPELFVGAEPSPASDVFALGMLLSELLMPTGVPPGWASRSLVDHVSRMVAHDPAARPSDLSVLAALLASDRARLNA